MGWFKSHKLWVIVALLLSVSAVIYFLRPSPPPTVTTRIETSLKSSRKTVDRSTSITKTRITKPDGTIVESNREIKNDIKVKEKSTERKQEVVTGKVQSRYRIGADWLPSIATPPSIKDSELRAGARVGDSNLWLEGGFDFKHRQAKIGLSIEW